MQLAEYIRMSTASQQDSPETQKSIIREYCEKNGHTIVRTYEDDAISGGSMEKRGALMEMLMDAEKRLFEGIVIYKYDRAFRNLEEQVFVFKRLKRHNIKVIAVADPGSEGASGELIVNILGAVNQFERQLTGERIYDKRRELAKKGRWTGSGINPFGYSYDKETKLLVIIPEEAEITRLTFDLYLQERSLSKVVDVLYSMGKKTKTGKEWTNYAVHQLLINPLYIGKLRWGFIKPNKGGINRACEVFDGRHEAIISIEVFGKVQALLQSNKRFSSNHSNNGNLLSGLLMCSLCGGKAVSAHHKARKKNMYYCKDKYYYHKNYCQGWHRMDYRLEEPVYEALVKNIGHVKLLGFKGTGKTGKEDNRQIEKKLSAIEAKLKRQLDMYEEGFVDKNTFKERRIKTLQEKEQIENMLRQDKPINQGLINLMAGFEETWKAVKAQTKREMLQTFISGIYTDGQKIKIEFVNLGLPGWEPEIEMPVK